MRLSRPQFYVFIACAISLLLPILAYLGHNTWYLELFAHLQIYYLVTLAIGSILLFIIYKKKYLLILSALFILWLSTQIFHTTKWNTGDDSSLRIVSFNLLSSNTNSAKVLEHCQQWSHEGKTNILFFMEVNAKWADELSTLKNKFPYFYLHPREDNFGIAIFSDSPLLDIQVLKLDSSGVPALSAKLELRNSKNLFLLGVHPLPPIGEHYFKSRNEYLNKVSEMIKTVTGPKIVFGDFNLTPWSIYYTRFTQSTNLQRASGFIEPITWRSLIFAFAIDHVFYSNDIQQSAFKVGEDLGSDHLPVIVDLLI